MWICAQSRGVAAGTALAARTLAVQPGSLPLGAGGAIGATRSKMLLRLPSRPAAAPEAEAEAWA